MGFRCLSFAYCAGDDGDARDTVLAYCGLETADSLPIGQSLVE